MLTFLLPETDDFEAVELRLEHSLLSLSKWEALHKKAFFRRDEQTPEETKSYIEQMLLDPPPPNFTARIDHNLIEAVQEYINDPQTATTFREAKQAGGSGAETVNTNELIYYWLVQFQIPFWPTETWHLNRLFVLIKIAALKQSKPKPMSRAEAAAQQRKLNAERRQSLGTAG